MLGFNLKRFFTVRTVVNLSNPISSLDSRVSRFLFKRTEAFERSCYSRSINYDYAFERGGGEGIIRSARAWCCSLPVKYKVTLIDQSVLYSCSLLVLRFVKLRLGRITRTHRTRSNFDRASVKWRMPFETLKFSS